MRNSVRRPGHPRTGRDPGRRGDRQDHDHHAPDRVPGGDDAFPASEILAVTFTEKAAGELKARLARLGVEGVEARTFHSAALSQLRGSGKRVPASRCRTCSITRRR